ncbi:ATP-binding protein [Dickeya dianthicola]|uniref:ATP-binding protein n=1 Tax=Dickeya dianthicola TaxID=204039 RepID=UPI0018672F10|nr:AAA family ATPase [Dickeya dianthicola]QOL12757.1 AAA family ATPase [Dickeya dianthicola]
MDNIAGSPVEGENFFGRETEVNSLKETLKNHDVLLLGPRRIGKTSLSREVMSGLQQQGWRTVEVNVASCTDEISFLNKLETALTPEMASVSDKAKAAISEIFAPLKRIKAVKIPVPGAGSFGVELNDGEQEDWIRIADAVLHLMSQADESWLIYIDELPIWLFNIIHHDPLNGVQRVRRFLDWFRNDVRAQPANRNIHWLITGSVGLDTLTQEYGMADTINSLKHESLKAFSNQVAVDMLLKLARRYEIQFQHEDAQHLVDAVQWPQPYYLQKVFNELRSMMVADSTVTVSALIEKVIEGLIQPGQDNDFHHWERRLTMQLKPDDAAHTKAMLNAVARDRLGSSARALLDVLHRRMPDVPEDGVFDTFKRLRDILLRDGYLWADEGTGDKRYRFHLEPLRRWWDRRNSL